MRLYLGLGDDAEYGVAAAAPRRWYPSTPSESARLVLTTCGFAFAWVVIDDVMFFWGDGEPVGQRLRSGLGFGLLLSSFTHWSAWRRGRTDEARP